MTAYVWMLGVIFAAALLMKGNRPKAFTFILISCVALFVIMGFRDATKIGIDSTSSYYHQFQRITMMDWSELPKSPFKEFNIALPYLMKLISEWSGGNYQTFIIVISVFIMFSFARFVMKYSVSPVQSICYFLGLNIYVFMFSAEKQAIAMSILLFAFDAIMDKKLLRFLLLVGAAALFHYPALIFLPAYWLAKVRTDQRYVLYLLLALAVTYLFRDTILRLMLGAYGGDDLDVSMEGITFLRTKVLIMILIVISALVLRPPAEEKTLYTTLLSFMGVAIIFQTFCGYNNIFERLADYYFQFAVIFIPMVFEKPEEASDQRIGGIFATVRALGPVIFSAYGIWRFWEYAAGNPLFSPYSFYF